MFIGHYQSNFNKKKGRTSVPKKFADLLGKNIIVTKGYENSLLIVKKTDWQKIITKVSSQNFLSGYQRQTDRFILGNAFEISLDSQGRIVIPAKLRDYAQLKNKALFIGVGNRIELWSQENWTKNENFLEKNKENIAQKLNEELKQ